MKISDGFDFFFWGGSYIGILVRVGFLSDRNFYLLGFI